MLQPRSRARNFDVPYIIHSKFLKSRVRNLQTFQSGTQTAKVHSVHKSWEISSMELYSSCHNGVQLLGCWFRHCGARVYFFMCELGHWCKLGLKFSKLSPLRLLLDTGVYWDRI